MGLVASSILLYLYRMTEGPRTMDRVVGLDTMYINAIAMIVLVGIYLNSTLYFEAALLIAMMAPTLVAMALDTRTLHGVNVWDKPFKFEVALTVYLGTLAWFAGWLPERVRLSRWYLIYAIVVVACVAAEMVWIGGAAANGIASHFNTSNAAMQAIYSTMGALAVTLTSATMVYAVIIARDPNSPLDPVFRSSVVWGLALTFILTIAVAGFMASGTGHWVGGNTSDAEATAFMGWARDGGDLRVAHFFATHAMHAVPLAGLTGSRTAVWATAAAFTVLTLWCFARALMGLPPF